MNKILTLALFLSGWSLATHAHQIWIEQPAGQRAVIRFGEFGDNLREVSPGLLDKFGKPTATLVSGKGEKIADGSKTGTGFALPFAAGKGEAIVAEDASYPLYTFKQGEQKLTHWFRPAARLVTDFAAQQPKLTLDLVPTGQHGEFKVFYQAKPRPKTKVTLVTPSGWSREGHTDEHGVVKFDMPWQGSYVAEVSHHERTPGERSGANGTEAYDGVNYVTTLSYVKPDGIAPIPAGPAAPPGK